MPLLAVPGRCHNLGLSPENSSATQKYLDPAHANRMRWAKPAAPTPDPQGPSSEGRREPKSCIFMSSSVSLSPDLSQRSAETEEIRFRRIAVHRHRTLNGFRCTKGRREKQWERGVRV